MRTRSSQTLLAGLGSFPGYFLRLPEQNRRGPAVLASAPALAPLTPAQVRALQSDGGQVIDVRPVPAYAAGHIPGSLAIPLRAAFATWLGWLVPDPATPLVIVADPGQDLGEVIWQALKIGYENLAGTLAGGMPAWRAAGRPVAATPLLTPGQVDPATVIDVRQAGEYAGGHLPGARNIELGALTSQAAHVGPARRDHVRARRAGRHRRQRAGTRRAHRRGGPARRPAGLGGRHRAGAREQRVTSPGAAPAAGCRARPHRPAPPGAGVRLGLRANLAQFSLLVAVNALVGGTLGQERTVVPLLAEQTFHLAAFTSALTFILAFGAVKAVTNFFAGTLSDRYGRKPVLVAGWLVALPIPLLLIWAPNWGWVIAANVLLGVNQGLTWSTTVIMKIDLVGPARRGLAMGLNEAAGYGAVAITALATGYLAAAYGLRPAPFLLGAAYIALGLGLSAAAVRETRGHARHEAATHVAAADHLGGHLTTRQVAWLTSFSEPALSAACQAGMVNNLNDGVAWGLFPILYASHGLTVSQIGVLAALYPAVWGAGQLATGALSDRIGRKWLIAAGMVVQAAAIALIALGTTFTLWAIAAVLLGAGTAMVYPTLLAAIGDVAHPAWRARSVGVYRLWRDGGFAVGALLAGVIADAFGIPAAIWVVAALTAASGLIVAIRMYETRPAPPGRIGVSVR